MAARSFYGFDTATDQVWASNTTTATTALRQMYVSFKPAMDALGRAARSLSRRLDALSRTARARFDLAQFVTFPPAPASPVVPLLERRLRGRPSARAVRRRFANPQRRVLAFSR